MTRRRRPRIPITDPSFEYALASTHLAGTQDFWKRQQARIARVQTPKPPAKIVKIKSA